VTELAIRNSRKTAPLRADVGSARAKAPPPALPSRDGTEPAMRAHQELELAAGIAHAASHETMKVVQVT
jgi:hypothetical protein